MRDKPHTPKPAWIRSKMPSNQNWRTINAELLSRRINTVCQQANCPNLGECWERKTATLMILGAICTRGCRFCNITTGNPRGIIDPKEIQDAVEMVSIMHLDYIVITSVDRDDLPDLGSSHFSNVVMTLKNHYPHLKIEVLIPDFNGDSQCMQRIVAAQPFVIAHNLETVERLTPSVRDKRASYRKSLDVLHYYKTCGFKGSTKSSLMLGLGETKDDIWASMKDLREVGVDILTLGQYLRPSKINLSVEKYYTPEEFDDYKGMALEMGFSFVASGPMVRSSYRAADYLNFLEQQGNK